MNGCKFKNKTSVASHKKSELSAIDVSFLSGLPPKVKQTVQIPPNPNFLGIFQLQGVTLTHYETELTTPYTKDAFENELNALAHLPLEENQLKTLADDAQKKLFYQ